jgi:hypothetical protein
LRRKSLSIGALRSTCVISLNTSPSRFFKLTRVALYGIYFLQSFAIIPTANAHEWVRMLSVDLVASGEVPFAIVLREVMDVSRLSIFWQLKDPEQ